MLSNPTKYRRILSSFRTSSRKSTSKPSFYITTPIYYVNGAPHLGHAYTSVISDIIARFYRKEGAEVFYLTGTDEHGQKVEQTAEKNQKTPIQFADEVSQKFQNLNEILCCSNDDFIRTTEDRHKYQVLALWETLEKNGQIYLGSYEGWYSVRDEAFYSDSELVDGKAPTGADVEWVKEESYFFKLSLFTQQLLEHYENHPEFIAPKSRRNEVISFVGQPGGLRDLSISRTAFHWGIPLTSDPKHVVYVWLDALTNYLSALGLPSCSESDRTDPNSLTRFWPPSLQIVGKDILRFHAVYWPAFLMAANLPLPKRVFAHGWWTKEGQKMSKSIGNVLCPCDLVGKYGPDYLRFYLASEIAFGNDGDFCEISLANRVNGNLANDLGNLILRTLTLISKNCDGKIPSPLLQDFSQSDWDFITYCQRVSLPKIRQAMSVQDVKAYSDELVTLSSLANRYIDYHAPWHLKKIFNSQDQNNNNNQNTNQNNNPRHLSPEGARGRFHVVLYSLCEVIRQLAILSSPILPLSSEKILNQFGLNNKNNNHINNNNHHPLNDFQSLQLMSNHVDPYLSSLMHPSSSSSSSSPLLSHSSSNLNPSSSSSSPPTFASTSSVPSPVPPPPHHHRINIDDSFPSFSSLSPLTDHSSLSDLQSILRGERGLPPHTPLVLPLSSIFPRIELPSLTQDISSSSSSSSSAVVVQRRNKNQQSPSSPSQSSFDLLSLQDKEFILSFSSSSSSLALLTTEIQYTGDLIRRLKQEQRSIIKQSLSPSPVLTYSLQLEGEREGKGEEGKGIESIEDLPYLINKLNALKDRFSTLYGFPYSPSQSTSALSSSVPKV